jgi:hypothetical protein
MRKPIEDCRQVELAGGARIEDRAGRVGRDLDGVRGQGTVPAADRRLR